MLSMFGAVLMAVLAIAISKDYDYLGEWFDASTEALYADTRASAISNCWVVGAIYLGIALLCCVGFVYHKLRGNV